MNSGSHSNKMPKHYNKQQDERVHALHAAVAWTTLLPHRKTTRAEMSKISNLLSPWEEKLIETLETHLEEAEKRNQTLFFGAKLTFIRRLPKGQDCSKHCTSTAAVSS